jgi:hypothetical protein
MEVSDQLQAPATLTPMNELSMPFEYETLSASSAHLDAEEKIKIYCLCRELNSDSSDVQPAA